MKIKNAFTMVEILIAISVIGIVAVLSIPILTRVVTELEAKVAFRRTFSDLSNVVQTIKKDNNQTLVNAFTSTTDMKNKFAEYLKVTKNCNNSSTNGCWTYTWKQMDGTELSAPTSPGIILVNGAVFVFEDYFSSECDSTGANVGATTTFTNVCSDVMIDVNGPKKPNIIGKDIFYAWVLSNTSKPWGSTQDDAISGSKAASSTCSSSDGGWGCASKILKDEDD